MTYKISLTFIPDAGFQNGEEVGMIEDFLDRLHGLGYDVDLYNKPSLLFDPEGKISAISFIIDIKKTGQPLKISRKVEVEQAKVRELPRDELWCYLYLSFAGRSWERMIIEVKEYKETENMPPKNEDNEFEKLNENKINMIPFIVMILLVLYFLVSRW